MSAKELRLGIVKGVNVSVGDREEMSVEGGYDKEMAVEGGDDKENRRDAANHLKSKSNRYFDASTSTTGKSILLLCTNHSNDFVKIIGFY